MPLLRYSSFKMKEIFQCGIGYRNCGEQTNGFNPEKHTYEENIAHV